MTQIDLEQVLVREELFWLEKYIVKWHLEGDKNITFFHITAKIRISKNTITYLGNNEDLIHDLELLVNHDVTYFSNIFCFANFFQDQSIMYEMIPSLVDSNVNHFFSRIPSFEEIKMSVFNLIKDSDFGPNGFERVFPHPWHSIKEDVINIVI